MSELNDPLNRTTANHYDRAGNLTSIDQPNGMSIDYAYDDANRLQQKILDSGESFTYTYDGANNLTGVTDQGSHNYSWDYDGAGRITGSTDATGYNLDYQWDKSHNLTGVTGTDTTSYQYGSTNRLLSVTLPDSSNIYYYYDENGKVFQVKYPGDNHYRNIYYYPNNWCRQVQDNAFPAQSYYFNYSYYDNGNISSISSWDGTDNYTYDNNGRLRSWTHIPTSGSTTQQNYQYDAAGNITVKGSSSYSYNRANQISNTGFSYDNNGNLTSDTTYNYIYNAENQLTQVRRASDNSLIAAYTYNYNGLRKSKTVNGVTTNFHWDAFGNLVRESDTNGNTLAIYYYDSGGNLLGLKKNSQYYIYHKNLRGDIVTVTQYNKAIQAQYGYDPWGAQTSYTGTLVQPFTYAGYYCDAETGLYYLKSRYYNPTLGRFLTKDGYGFIKHGNPQTLNLNLYVYCGNNPVKYTDPTGHDVWNRFGEKIGTAPGPDYTDYSQEATDTHGGGEQASIPWVGGDGSSCGAGLSEYLIASADNSIVGQIWAGMSQVPGAVFNKEVGKAILQTGGTVVVVCAGPVSQFAPEILYCGTLVEAKIYLYADPATKAVKYYTDIFGGTMPETLPGAIYNILNH